MSTPTNRAIGQIDSGQTHRPPTDKVSTKNQRAAAVRAARVRRPAATNDSPSGYDAAGPLRPVGKARFAGLLIDVVTQGEYIEPPARVEVIERRGNRIVVRVIG